MSKTTAVPAWSVDGRRLRHYSEEAAEHLAGLSFVSAKRNRYGRILAIHFRDQDGGSALRVTAKMGQRYSILEREDEVRMWALTELTGEAADYRRVVLDTVGAV
jgi:hypothetical protein